MLPPDEVAVADPDVLLDRVDALLLAGGADIDPASYGAEPHPETRGTWPERDRFELALARRALERDMPVLGICRGMQLLNVALGGTLDQHLPESIGNEPHRAVAGTFSEHQVRLRAGLAGLRGGRAPRASSSGRTTTRGSSALGEGLRVSGWSVEDEIVEAIELPGQALRPRRRLAPRGGRRQQGDRGPGRAPREGSPRATASGWPSRRSSGVSALIEVIEPATEQVMAEVPRAGVEEVDAAVARGEGGVPGLARGRARRPGGADARGSPTRSRPSSRSWRGSRRATPASRSATPAARSGWWSRPSATTPARRSGCSARRSRSPAAST